MHASTGLQYPHQNKNFMKKCNWKTNQQIHPTYYLKIVVVEAIFTKLAFGELGFSRTHTQPLFRSKGHWNSRNNFFWEAFPPTSGLDYEICLHMMGLLLLFLKELVLLNSCFNFTTKNTEKIIHANKSSFRSWIIIECKKVLRPKSLKTAGL